MRAFRRFRAATLLLLVALVSSMQRSAQALDMGYSPQWVMPPPSAGVGAPPPQAAQSAPSGVSAHGLSPAMAADHSGLIAWFVIFFLLVLLRVVAETAPRESAGE